MSFSNVFLMIQKVTKTQLWIVGPLAKIKHTQG